MARDSYKMKPSSSYSAGKYQIRVDMSRATYNIWDLAEGLLFEIRWRLVFSFTHLNINEFEGNFLFMEDESNTQNIGGGISAIEL